MVVHNFTFSYSISARLILRSNWFSNSDDWILVYIPSNLLRLGLLTFGEEPKSMVLKRRLPKSDSNFGLAAVGTHHPRMTLLMVCYLITIPILHAVIDWRFQQCHCKSWKKGNEGKAVGMIYSCYKSFNTFKVCRRLLMRRGSSHRRSSEGSRGVIEVLRKSR